MYSARHKTIAVSRRISPISRVWFFRRRTFNQYCRSSHFIAGSGSHLTILYKSGFGTNCTKVKSSGIFCRYATGVGAGVVFSYCLRCKEFKEADVDRPDSGLFLRGLLRIRMRQNDAGPCESGSVTLLNFVCAHRHGVDCFKYGHWRLFLGKTRDRQYRTGLCSAL